MINPFAMDEEAWTAFIGATRCLPDDSDERDFVLSLCKHVSIVKPVSESQLQEWIHEFGLLYPDYRLLSESDRGYVVRAYMQAFEGVEEDLIEVVFETIRDSAAIYMPPPGYAYSTIEPLVIARHEWRQQASRLSAAIEPGLKLVKE